MMSLMKKLFLAAAIFAALETVTPAFASEQDNETSSAQVWDSMIRKLGRGISNVAFGVVEFPVNWYQVNFEEGGFAACTYGIFKGLTAVVVREVVGVVEIVTFFSPLPGCTDIPDSPAWGYGPILEPEWIITPAQNNYNFVYPETTTLP